MAFSDYSLTPASNTTLADGTYVGPNMLRNKVRPALQQIMADGKAIANEVGGLTVTVNTLVTPGAFEAELIRDTMATALVAGTNVSITPNDAANTITIAATASGGGTSSAFTPEQYGAVGNGTTNDTVAFQNLAAAVNAAGGGLVEYKSGATYALGIQSPAGVGLDYALLGAFNGCTKPLILRGNGATIKYANGLKYGRFKDDLVTPALNTQIAVVSITHVGTTATVTMAAAHNQTAGTHVAISGAVPNEYNTGGTPMTVLSTTTFSYTMASTPASNATVAGAALFGLRVIPVDYFEGLLTVKACTGPVHVSDLVLDGNVPNLIIGGQDHAAGDSGFQIPGDGLFAKDNTGGEIWENILVKNAPRDGVILSCAPSPGATAGVARIPHVFRDCLATNCGRLGLSITGGRGYVFERCRGLYSGTGPTGSAPASGMDIEAESAPIRDVTLLDCEFYGNTNNGLVMDSGNNGEIIFKRCSFIGTGTWAAWLSKQFYAEDCLFVGANNIAYDNADITKAAKFLRCRFTDSILHSPTGFLGTVQPILNGGGGTVGNNNIYEKCSIEWGNAIPASPGFAASANGLYGPAIANSIFIDTTLTVIGATPGMNNVAPIFRDKCTLTSASGSAGIGNMPGYRVMAGGVLIFNGTRYHLADYANDAAAAAGGVLIGEQYRNGTDVMVRVV